MTKARLLTLVLAAVIALYGSSPVAAQVTTGTIVGTVSDAGGVVPGATVSVREVNKGTTTTYVTDETGNYTASFLVPGTYAVEVNVQGFKKSVREGINLQVNQRARVDVTLEVGRIEETTTVVVRGAARPDRFIGSRHRHRGTGDQGIAAQRPELRDAGVSDAWRDARSGRREPLGREHVQPARRVELQRPRAPGERQRLAHRRHRQQRVLVQHRHHRAVGRAGARVQGADRRLLRRVRPWRRRRLGLDQVGHERLPWHRVRVHARRRLRRAQLLRSQRRSSNGNLVVDPKPPLNRNQYGAAVGGPIIKSRTFFFADYAGLHEKRGQVFVNTVPTARDTDR